MGSRGRSPKTLDETEKSQPGVRVIGLNPITIGSFATPFVTPLLQFLQRWQVIDLATPENFTYFVFSA